MNFLQVRSSDYFCILTKFVKEAPIGEGSLEKTVRAFLIALCFVLREPFFCRKNDVTCHVSTEQFPFPSSGFSSVNHSLASVQSGSRNSSLQSLNDCPLNFLTISWQLGNNNYSLCKSCSWFTSNKMLKIPRLKFVKTCDVMSSSIRL